MAPAASAAAAARPPAGGRSSASAGPRPAASPAPIIVHRFSLLYFEVLLLTQLRPPLDRRPAGAPRPHQGVDRQPLQRRSTSSSVPVARPPKFAQIPKARTRLSECYFHNGTVKTTFSERDFHTARKPKVTDAMNRRRTAFLAMAPQRSGPLMSEGLN